MLQYDEKVGVYGFIFCRDGDWVDVIIDECVRFHISYDSLLNVAPNSQLFTLVPRWEGLTSEVRTRLIAGERILT